MVNITIVPVWIIQDILVLIIATLMVFYIINNEERPKIVLMQFICFVFFYAAAFENVAVSMGLMGNEAFLRIWAQYPNDMQYTINCSNYRVSYRLLNVTYFEDDKYTVMDETIHYWT